MLVSVGQFDPAGSPEANVTVMRTLAGQARAAGAQLVIFPEESMCSIGKVAGEFAATVAAHWSSFVRDLTAVAQDLQIAVIAGGYEPSSDHRPYNTLVVIDAEGRVVETYRKLHLYDAFSYRESNRIAAGDEGPKNVNLGGLNVGVMTCYDLRFPEMARVLAEEGADLIAVPSAWFTGDHKVDHWETLLKARAIENTCWVAAAGTASAHTIGHSAIIDPMGVPQDFLEGETQGLVTVDVTRRRIDEVREFLPVLRNRRLLSSRTLVPAPNGD
ncbi:carbon-nitrogen hydrolase family protein [Tersicoccus sp. Bi-70]|uniref:carbon-nitrogen hydrolase family protein n=1 Tax=Tersicoccus sp. Bi-70 TaxID=1897634 RepID=UPI0009788B55|nr:carbon-nitrogen hydrolase family protein [Tersicoccus sp. Bi-70]OMH32297.1 carbon-nitrogen hydrolase [Tersicoccus sp. Bi-70]